MVALDIPGRAGWIGDLDACDALLTAAQIGQRDRPSMKALMSTDRP